MNRQINQYSALVFFFTFTFLVNLNAQQQHFIYIQADSSKQFIAGVNDKNFASSSAGFVILSKLQDGQYNISISFTSGNYPTQSFVCTIDKKDLGFQLKNFGSKGWGLFNTETLNVIMAGETARSATAKDSIKPVSKTNAFGNMLGDVVDDSTLSKPVTETDSVTLQPEIMPAVAVKNSINDSYKKTDILSSADSIIKKTHSISQNIQPSSEDAAITATAGNSTKGMIKASEESDDEGTKVTFVDFNNNNKNDTINIFIPAVNGDLIMQKEPAKTISNTAVSGIPSFQNNNSTNGSKDTVSVNTGNPFYKSDQSFGSSVISNSDNTIIASNPAKPSAVFTKTDCSKMASDDDLDKIKKKMLKETGATEMTLAVKKMLSGKCVTTEQVKTMSNLFSSDDARYNFYEAMYNFTYDYGNYPALRSQLLDAYYKKRFDALLR